MSEHIVAITDKQAKAVALLLEACAASAKVLGPIGLKNDEAWGVFSQCINALTKAQECMEPRPSPIMEEETGK